jgi:UDP-glucose 4-epimerase
VGKLAGEHYVRVFARLHGIEAVTLRYFNVFGPRQDGSSPYSGVISRFLSALTAGEVPVIYGDGQQSRDFTYVDDVVAANLLALHARGTAGEPVNVAGGRQVTLLELLGSLAHLLGRAPIARHVEPRSGDVRHSRADLARAREILGYRPVVDLETGLRRTLEWHEEVRRAAVPAAS